jgi:hypothetical protein
LPIFCFLIRNSFVIVTSPGRFVALPFNFCLENAPNLLNRVTESFFLRACIFRSSFAPALSFFCSSASCSSSSCSSSSYSSFSYSSVSCSSVSCSSVSCSSSSYSSTSYSSISACCTSCSSLICSSHAPRNFISALGIRKLGQVKRHSE